MSSFAKSRAIPALALALCASPALAGRQDEPAMDREPDAQAVAMTPLTDLNLSKDPIPPVLLAAVEDPYADDGIEDCARLTAAIADLDAVLGPDMDVAESERDRISWGRIATSAVGSFIPFRGVVRELSGAADHKRDFQAAIYAGAVRRGFLKGLGQQKGCAYPARPAFARVAVEPKKRRGDKAEPPAEDGVTFVAEPVVQPVPKTRLPRK